MSFRSHCLTSAEIARSLRKSEMHVDLFDERVRARRRRFWSDLISGIVAFIVFVITIFVWFVAEGVVR